MAATSKRARGVSHDQPNGCLLANVAGCAKLLNHAPAFKCADAGLPEYLLADEGSAALTCAPVRGPTRSQRAELRSHGRESLHVRLADKAIRYDWLHRFVVRRLTSTMHRASANCLAFRIKRTDVCGKAVGACQA